MWGILPPPRASVCRQFQQSLSLQQSAECTNCELWLWFLLLEEFKYFVLEASGLFLEGGEEGRCRLPSLCLGQAGRPEGRGEPGEGWCRLLLPGARANADLSALLPLLCSLPASAGHTEFTWSLQSEPVTWTDCATYGCNLGLKNWVCPPPLPAPVHSFSVSGMQALSYTAQWRLNVTISKASAGKKTLTSAKLGWGFALRTFSRSALE